MSALQQAQVVPDDPNISHIHRNIDMPQDAPVVIFVLNDIGMLLSQYCHKHGIEIKSYIDIELRTDADAPVLSFDDLQMQEFPDTNLLISIRNYHEYLPALREAKFKKIYVAHTFGTALLATSKTKHKLKQGQIYDSMITGAPSPQHDIDIFSGDWLSEVPIPGVTSGWNKMIDARLPWAEEAFGSFKDMRILELGPYEGLHTYALERLYGAAEITSVEANPRAFLRCLIVKNLFDLKNSRFLLGNFFEYLNQTDQTFDMIFGCGVLYHMTNPRELLEAASKKTRRLFLWTYFYDEAIIRSNANLNFRFDHARDRDEHFNDFVYREHCFIYRDGTQTTDHLGGVENYAYWLKAEDILTLLRLLGFTKIQTGLIDQEHAFGPHFCVAAEK